MNDRRPLLATFAILAALLVGAYSDPLVNRINGFTVGPAYDCAGDGLSCAEVVDVALGALGDRDPGHPDVAGSTVYHEEMHKRMTHTGTVLIVAFDLVDGTHPIMAVYAAPGGFAPMPEYVP